MSGVGTKTIWTLWLQGFASAPDLVRLCVESWQRLNPGWQVRVLERADLSLVPEIRDTPPERVQRIAPQQVSEMARVSLLRHFGGVWADPTVFCAQPLDEWLDACATTGFFAFGNPGRDRLLSTWFIAGHPDNELLAAMHARYAELWETGYFARKNTLWRRAATRALASVLNRTPRSTSYWLSLFPTKVLKVYPWFIMNYVFNDVVVHDADLQAAWQAVPRFDASAPHFLQRAAAHEGLTEALAHIDRRSSPVYKLNWRVDAATPYWSAVLQHLRAALATGGAPNAPR